MKCMLCPLQCGADRDKENGACCASRVPLVARAALHLWEEPCISGTNGSGTVFFSGCNMRCVFCQNYVLNDGTLGKPFHAEELANIYLSLERKGAHNINLVTPTPHLIAVRDSLRLAKDRGLRIPVVYNTNGYELVSSLKALEGLVDIYLPDFKYVSPVLADRFSGRKDYFEYASSAILEMYRQVGLLQTDENDIATRGLIIRHLVLPACVDEARRVFDYIAENLPKEVTVSVMRQYAPIPVPLPKPLDRRVTDREYDRAVEYALSLGLNHLYIQQKDSATLAYTPDFSTFTIL